MTEQRGLINKARQMLKIAKELIDLNEPALILIGANIVMEADKLLAEVEEPEQVKK